MIAPFGADDVAGLLYAGERLRKLRFLMTDNKRNFAHQFDTGGLDRLYVRGKKNVHKKFLIQAAACNLALLMRSTYGSGKPRAAHDAVTEAVLTILAVMRALEGHFSVWSADADERVRVFRRSGRCSQLFCRPTKWPV